MWLITDTVYRDRKNWFSMRAGHEFHVGTIVSGSREKLDRFHTELATLIFAPQMRAQLEGVVPLLNELATAESKVRAIAVEALLKEVSQLERVSQVGVKV